MRAGFAPALTGPLAKKERPEMKTLATLLVLWVVSIPCITSAECTFVDRGDTVVAVCGEQNQEKVDPNIAEIADIIERYKNGISKETYERCKDTIPIDHTAEEYAQMTQGQRIDAMNQYRNELVRYVATGCKIRGGSTAILQNQRYILCTSVANSITCSDKTWYRASGNTVTDNKGATCHIVDSSMDCSDN